MFIIIWEDGSIFQASGISEEDKQAADDGIMDIIDITDKNKLSGYTAGTWQPLGAWRDGLGLLSD